MTPEEFWSQDEGHKDQKFYGGFCLLESALGDYAVARDLHRHNKLNWASTTYYYSIVHALRLLCFVAKGDFPTGHTELTNLYKNSSCNVRDRNSWLHHFIKNIGTRVTIGPRAFKRKDITKYFGGRQTSSLLDGELTRWGEILDKARECRNDSNYEGLIIAHEHGHRYVTDDFKKLANTLCKACEDILPEVVSLFKDFIDRNNPRSDYWYAYLNWKAEREGLYYFEDSLKSRLLGRNHAEQLKDPNQDIIDKILPWLDPLRKNNIENNLAANVFGNISLGIFRGKESLMQNFHDKISELTRLVNNEQRGC
ncbi:MAG TPA: hypothetical protein ACFYD2_02510 [Candidatus Avalokitesvara rifleensis]|uniref:hypothetical protein n=1 Tax=Candidatus Avalokitesvara rifleensis TaxID=3367620 RepID=UPI0027132A6F|nr:hypothetical protein [Candidatus Brocadiales bacterium]